MWEHMPDRAHAKREAFDVFEVRAAYGMDAVCPREPRGVVHVSRLDR